MSSQMLPGFLLSTRKLPLEAEKTFRGPKPAAESMSTTVEQHTDPVWILRKNGFALGQVVYTKETGSSPATQLFYITSVAETIKLSQVMTYTGEALMLEVKVLDFIQRWSVYTGQLPIRMKNGQNVLQSFEIDELRDKLYMAFVQ